MPRTGRPKLIIDWELVKRLASIHCTVSEIAFALDISISYAEKSKEFMRVYKKYIEGAKQSLRRLQWEKAQGQEAEVLRGDEGEILFDDKHRPLLKCNAVNPDTTMQIWLGKQYLAQKDKQEVTGAEGESLKPQTNIFNGVTPETEAYIKSLLAGKEPEKK